MVAGVAQTMTEAMDENTRRYYLDAMGIQCWESLDAGQVDTQPAIETSPDVSTTESSDREVAATTYDGLESAIQSCVNCALHKRRTQAIAGRGSLSAELMFVLLSPSANDDKNELICGGEAGDLLSKMLAAININIGDVYITSLLKCRVAANHTISPAEIQACNTHLKQQIQLIRPKLIIVLGETTARCLLQKELSIDDSRAMNDNLSQQLVSVPLFFSYSPEELLLQAAHKRKAWSDLQQLQKIIESNNN